MSSGFTDVAQMNAALAFCRALTDGVVDRIAGLTSDSPDFFHEYAPKSLGKLAEAPRCKKEMLEHFRIVFSQVVQQIELPPKQIVQGPDSIVFLVSDSGLKRDGSPYHVEYILTFRFEPGSDKILGITEFQDSAYFREHFAELAYQR
ncbi:hypothetical protein PUNSTDRAFT_133210 [Punctularia strigosozonata HHB-11173 SS5]|uniref:uncharacterized protein n=1 Tax=Punctularia strigosozonata (strain HHB-11173) TaxID=741275 RepID=UPI0004417C9B|nr:uncharacterized protein PUNSTDRAFT_133210 [Punctularia strigosozonata HHB-11173 SS5]EIN09420.1 hypothetical protein PUNSTDRAFT_133210 [Punctularia strigosozonata HHB-11173 SS5]